MRSLRSFPSADPAYRAEYNRRYRAENKDRIKAQDRDYRSRSKYGISADRYDEILSDPCHICGGESEVLDHCHASGNNRGPLCRLCNTGIGALGDDPARLRAAADYLERHAITS